MVDNLFAGNPKPTDARSWPGLVHGIAVLQALQKKPRVTQSELSALTGLTRATARRSLITLASLGYVEARRRRLPADAEGDRVRHRLSRRQ